MLPVSIKITSSKLKKGKADVQTHDAEVYHITHNTIHCVLTDVTMRYFDRTRFTLTAGCEIEVDGKKFIATNVSVLQASRSKHPYIEATLAA